MMTEDFFRRQPPSSLCSCEGDFHPKTAIGILFARLKYRFIWTARLGSMEGNVFTIIGNRMKGRRACWSIDGGNRLAALLCKHYSVSSVFETNSVTNICESANPPLSATKAPKKDGKGYEFSRNISIPSDLKWLKQISYCKPLSDLSS